MPAVKSDTAHFDDILSCKNLNKFADSIHEVLMFGGYSESKFFICKIGKEKTKYLVKMAFYKKTNPELYTTAAESNQNATKPPHDVELAVLELLKQEITIANISPCIIDLIHYVKCNSASIVTPKVSTCHQYITESKSSEGVIDSLNMIFCNYAELVRNDLAFDKFNYLVLENCDVTFHEYLTHLRSKSSISFEQFRSFMFQIIYTVYRIKRIYPSFRHGDLHSENIMIKYDKNFKYDPAKPKFYKFHAAGKVYYVPYFGIICKLIDFGFTIIEEKNIKSSILGDKFITFMKTKNDLLFLLFDIWNTQGENKMVGDFLEKLEPNKTYLHYNTDYITHIDKRIPTVSDMIDNEVFGMYRRYSPTEEQIVHEFALDNAA